MQINTTAVAKRVEVAYPAVNILRDLHDCAMSHDTKTYLDRLLAKIVTAVVKSVQDEVDTLQTDSVTAVQDEEFWKACVVAGLKNSEVITAINDADVALATLLERRKPETEGEQE